MFLSSVTQLLELDLYYTDTRKYVQFFTRLLVEHFARRLQVQERLTKQIADCIKESIGASGVAVMIECEWVHIKPFWPILDARDVII